jgi:hypothetical protein
MNLACGSINIARLGSAPGHWNHALLWAWGTGFTAQDRERGGDRPDIPLPPRHRSCRPPTPWSSGRLSLLLVYSAATPNPGAMLPSPIESAPAHLRTMRLRTNYETRRRRYVVFLQSNFLCRALANAANGTVALISGSAKRVVVRSPSNSLAAAVTRVHYHRSRPRPRGRRKSRRWAVAPVAVEGDLSDGFLAAHVRHRQRPGR